MRSKKVKSVTSDEFNNIYKKNKIESDKDAERLFKKTIEQIDNFSSSLNFWYLADFRKGVIKVGGDCELVTPLTKKEWLGLFPWDIGKMFHPLDVSKMRAFIVFIADFLAKKTDKEREKIRISLVFRMLNANKQYTWRLMEYPAMNYVKNEPRYLLCHISEINHIVNQPKCRMYILDSTEKESTMFYCDDEKTILKPINPQKKLSEREIEIIKLLVKGLISKEIGKVLNISKNTVENHKQNIYSKTGTKKINELITFANRNLIDNTTY